MEETRNIFNMDGNPQRLSNSLNVDHHDEITNNANNKNVKNQVLH